MRLTHFFVERPIFASVIAIVITLVGAFAYPLLPVSQFPQIAPPSINVNVVHRPAVHRHRRLLPRRLGRSDFGNGAGAAGTADQRRGEHDLHELHCGGGGTIGHFRVLRAGHRPRHRAGTGAEPRRRGRAAPAGTGAQPRHHGIQAGAGLPVAADDDHLRSRHRHQLPRQLRELHGARPPAAHRRRGRHPGVWRRRLRHACVDRSRQGRSAQPHCHRDCRRTARAERAGGGRCDRPAAGTRRCCRVPVAHPGGRPSGNHRGVRIHRAEERQRRPHAPARRGARGNLAPELQHQRLQRRPAHRGHGHHPAAGHQ